jgi:hypothetical protein
MRKTRHERSWKSVQISARTKIASGRILWRGPLSGKNQKNQQKESASGGKRRRPDSVPPRSRNRAKPTGPGQTNTKEKCDLRADFTEPKRFFGSDWTETRAQEVSDPTARNKKNEHLKMGNNELNKTKCKPIFFIKI